MNTIRSQWRELSASGSPAVFRILAHGILFGLSFSIADILFNFYLTSLGYDNAVAGQLQSVFRIAGVIFGFPVGMFIDKISAKRMLYIGILTYAIGWAVLLMIDRVTLVTPFGTLSPLMLMNTVFFIIGAANMATYTAVVPLLSLVIEPRQRVAMFGINAAASTLIGFVGSILGGMLPGIVAPLAGVDATSEVAYRIALYSVTAIGFLAVVPLLGIKTHHTHGADSQTARADTDGDKPLVPMSRLILLVTPSFFFGTAGGLFVPFQNLFYRQQFGMTDGNVGLNLAVAALAMGVGSILGGPLSKRFGVRQASAWSRMLGAPLMLAMLIPVLTVVSISYDINRLLVGMTFPLFAALMMQTVPLRQRGTSTSLSSMSWSLGWAGASVLSGTITANGSFTWVLVLSAASYVISGALISILPYTDKHD
jgi:MFS family permease